MPFGLYISVPFCRSKCTYCNFASGVFSATQMGRYVERLIEDMRGIRAYAAPLGTEIPETADSIYLGGGTPSLLPPEELKKLFFALRQEFNVLPKAEITVECAPGTLTGEIIQALDTRRKPREPGRAVICRSGSRVCRAAAYAGEDAERH